MSFERLVRVARLPEMRLAYFETSLPAPPAAPALAPEVSALWDSFNEWRVQARPALGRIDIAALGWALESEEGAFAYRTAVPIRSDYQPPAPAKTTFFPGGPFAYCYADDVDEFDEAVAAVARWLAEQGIRPRPGAIEAYKFHYNLDQHPADCGFLLPEGPAAAGPAGPLPIARA
ncbi:MAG: GyrI-like domain-containing protein [Tepidiformaceae bacterium]